MDKGRSKTDLRAAGKKRLEEFRQKRQQKGSSTKPNTTTALKALTESEQNSEENAVEEISRRDSLPKEEAQRPFSEKDGEVESAVDHGHEVAKALEEPHVDISPASSVTPSIQRLKVGGHLAPETSEQSVDSPCEPGSSNGNVEDKDREAVYTILWENHGTDHSQRTEEWQESTLDGGNERALDQGKYSTFRVDDENYGSDSKVGSSTQRKLSGGNSNDAVDKLQSSEGIKEWDEHSLSQQRPVHDAEAEEGREVLSVDPGFKGSFPKEGSVEERMLPERNQNLEPEKADQVSEVALLLLKLEQIVEESGREREFHENEIRSLKSQAREKDEAVSARDAQLEELEVARALSEQKLRTALERTEKEKEQLLQECMDVKSQVGKLAEERDKFLSSIDVYEKDLEVLRADSTNLTVQMSHLSEEKNQLTTELCAAREQAAAALEHEAQLLRNLRGLEEEREDERTRLQSLEVQLEDILLEKTQLEVTFGESTKVLGELRVANKQLSDELAVSEQERNISSDRIKTMEDEQLKFHDLVENLTHQLSMYEEKAAASEAVFVQGKNSEEECKRLQFVVENLEMKLHSLEDEKAEVGCKCRDLQVQKEELITEVEITKNELKVAQNQLEVSRTQQSEIDVELTTVKLELTKALADEEESRQKLEHVKDQFGKLETERTQIEEFWGQKLQLTEENVSVLEEQKVGLEETLAGAKHDLEQLSEQLKKVDTEKAELNETLRAELQHSNEKVNTLVAEKVEMEAAAETLHRKATVLEDQNSELEQRSKMLSEEKDRLVSELGSSQRVLETMQEERVQLELELWLLREKLLQIKDQFGKLETERSQIEEIWGQKLQLTEENVRVLEEQKVGLEELLSGANHDLEQLNEQLRKVDTEKAELNETLRAELQHSNEKVNTLVAEKAETEATAETLHRKATVLEDQNSELTQRSNMLIEEKGGLVSELGSSQRALETIQEERVQLESELWLLREKLLHIRSDWETLLEKLNGVTSEKEFVANELKVSQNALQKVSEESRSVTSELSLVAKKLDESTELNNKLTGDLQSLQEMLQGAEEGKARVEIELQESLSKLNGLEIEKSEFRSHVQQLEEAVNQKDAEIRICKEERKQSEVDSSAKLETEVAKSHELITELCNLKAELQTLEQKNYKASDEPCSPTSDKESENMSLADFENASPRSHAANVKLVKKLVEVFEGKATDDVEPIQNQRGFVSPVTQFVIQAQAMKKTTDDLQRDRDAATLAETTLRAELDTLTMKLRDVSEERFNLQAAFTELQENLAIVTAECSRLKHTIDNLMNGDGEGVKMVSVLEGDKRALQAQTLELAEKLRAAEESMLEDQALKQDLQKRSEELDAELQTERDAPKTILSRLDSLSNYIEEHVLTIIPELVWTSGAADPVSQIEYKVALVIDKVLSELVAKAHTLEEERDLVRTDNNVLQVERSALISEKEVLKSELEVKMTNETETRASVVDVEAVREMLLQERDGLFEKVKLLEKELTLLQEEQERVSHEYQALLELEAKAKVDGHEKIQMLESTVDDLQRGSEEREAEARSVYERDMKLLNSRFESIQTELDKVRDLHIRFDEKLESAALEVLPTIDVKPVDFEDNLFDYSWAIVNLILEEYSRRLQHAHADMTELESKVNSGKEEEIRMLQELVRRITEELAAANEERDGVAGKVKALEEERTLLQEEQERVTHELKLEAKAKVYRQEKIQMLESTVDDLQRGLEEEAEARTLYERDMQLLHSRLQGIQNELDKVRDLHIRFDEKLESAAREVLPTIDVKPVDLEDNLFDYSWAIVNLILEEYSRKLQHAHADMTELESKVMNSGKEEEIRALQELVQRTTAELVVAKEEKGVAQSELAQLEKRLGSTKERLTLAINKGKSIVVQRDAAKASLAEKTGELQRVASEYKEMMQLKDIALQEAEAATYQAEILKVELVEVHNTSERLDISLSETRSALLDLEVAVDKITLPADHSSETRVAKLEWVAATLKDLQMRLSYYESKAESLITDLTTVSNEKDAVLQELQNVSLKCERLEKITEEDASSIAAQKSEIENLQDVIVTMEAEAAQHLKMQHAVMVAIGVLYSEQDSEVDPTLSSSFSESELGAAVNFYVNKYKVAVHELDELREQSDSLRDAIAKLEEEKTFVSAEKLQSLQGMLQARDIELRDAITKLEGATRVISEQEEEGKGYVQQNERLKEELMGCNQDLGMLKADFSVAEKKMMGLKNELHEVVDSFKSIPEELNSRIEGVTLSMNEMVTEVNSLVKTIVEQADKREMELQIANDARTELVAKFEQEILDSRNAAQGISWLHGPPPPSSSLLDWVTWLVDALQEEHQKLEEVTKTADENALEVQRLRERSDSLLAELSNQQNEQEAVAGELRRRDLELGVVKDKLQELAEKEVEFVRSFGHVENALMRIEEIVEEFQLQGRPSSTASPTEWISWLIQAIGEVSQELKTSKNDYSSLHEELLSQMHENENLQNRLREVYETFNVERDSLKADIQVLKDSFMEISSREFEFSEAHRAATHLQEKLAFKNKELSELHDEMEALSLRHAQQDSKLQPLMEERERLSSEVVILKAERNRLQTELLQAANEKTNLQSDINQLEQKLVVVREKLNLAVNKGKGLAKQRDSLKQSLAEETAKVASMVSSHAKELQVKDAELLEIRTRVQESEAEVSSLHKKSTASQERMQTERQRLETALSGVEISEDGDPIEKVEWLVSFLEGTRNRTNLLEGELDSTRNALETLKAVLRDTEERLQSVTVESLRAQETLSLSVKNAEEVESRATYDRAQYKNEIDGLSTALKEADVRQHAAWSRVKELEKSFNASEAARSKTVSKLTFTRNKLNLLVQDSQELVKECESLHKSLQGRNAEIAELNHEVGRLQNIIHTGSKSSLQLTLLQEELARASEKSAAAAKEFQELQATLQSAVREKDAELEGVWRKIEDILLKGDNVLWVEYKIINPNKGDDDSLGEMGVQSMNGSQDFASVITTLEQRFDNLVADAQKYRNSSDKKEAQIQKLQKELYEVSIEKTSLQASVEAKTMDVERLQSQVGSKGAPGEGSTTSAQSEIEELGTRSTWSGPGNPATPHVRGPRRQSQAEIAIDMDVENNSILLLDMNDKEHGFSALTNSRLVPKATRILADRLDGLWFAGGRILTRQPSARLGLAVYWIFIHVYMAMVFFRGIL